MLPEGKMKQVFSGQWSVVSGQKIGKEVNKKTCLRADTHRQVRSWEDKKVRILNFSISQPLIFCFLLFTIFTGCASKQEEVKPSLGYFEVLNQMTKSKKVIESLESKLFIYATYKNWALREAYVDEYARRYRMDSLQKEGLISSEKEIDEQFNEFFIAVYTPVDKWNDFIASDSIWKIFMEDVDGNRVTPVKIKKVDAESPLIKEFYPYLDPWSSGYIIKFPKYTISGDKPFPDEEEGYLKLIVTSVVGSAELEWQLQ